MARRLIERIWTALSAAAAVIAAPGLAQACDFDDAEGPDVALVLSGGGALAASQVGAIRVIEEAGVPIHCVLGTSMGAVVGALYAAGHDGEALHEIFIDAEWGEITTGSTPYRNRSFTQKEDQRDFFSDYVLGFSDQGLTLPSGVSSLRTMRRFLRHWTDHVSSVEDFNALAVPYRAVATDLSTGEAVILDRGDLVSAAVASMAVPALYSPEVIGDRVLVDGGMSKQVPIDVAREMGADIVIVIDNTRPPADLQGRPPSAAATALQLVTLQVYANWREQIQLLEDGDVHIIPDITGFSSYDFSRMGEGEERGVAAAEAVRAELEALAARAAPPRRRTLARDAVIQVADVDVARSGDVSPSLVRQRFEIAPGDTVSRADLQVAVDQVAALNAFTSVDYRLVPGPAGTRVQIEAAPRPVGEDLVQAGARFSTTTDGDADYALLARWSRQPYNDWAGVLSISAEVGSDLAADISLFQPLGAQGRYFLQPVLAYADRTVAVTSGEQLIAERRDETFDASLRAGRELGLWGLVSADIFAVAFNTDIRVGQDFGDALQDGEFYGARLRFAADTMNSISFPTSGVLIDVTASQFVTTTNLDDATVGEISLGWAGQYDGAGLFLRLDAGTIEQDGVGVSPFALGGFKRLSGFIDDSVPATDFALARAEVYRRLGGRIDETVGSPVYIGATLEAAHVEFELVDTVLLADTVFAGSLYAAVNTPIGPGYLAYGYGESGRQAIYLFFGRAF